MLVMSGVQIADVTSQFSESERPLERARFQQVTARNHTGIKLKSLILAQIERWRHALHMQVERQHGSNPGGEWRTGE